MNKKLFITTAVVGVIGLGGLFAGNASAKQAVHTAFKDERFYQCVVTAYNNLEGATKNYETDILTDAELLKVTSLDCSKKSNTADADKVAHVDGLEKLTNITSLNLRYNQIGTIDVSKNTKLTSLDVGYNKLNTLDISSNSELKNLYIKTYAPTSSDENNVSELDIRNNLKLEKIFAKDAILYSSVKLVKSGDKYIMDLSSLKFITNNNMDVSVDGKLCSYDANNFVISITDIAKVNHIELRNNANEWSPRLDNTRLAVDKSGLAEEGKETEVPVPNTSGDAKTDTKTDAKTDTKTETKAAAEVKEDTSKKSSVKSPDTGSLTNEDGANKLALIIATPIMAAAGVVATLIGKRVFRKKVGF